MASWRSPETLTFQFHDHLSVRRTTYRFIGNTDLFVSNLSLGGGPLGDLYGRTADAESVVLEALRNGINFIDTSYWTGLVRSEEILGRILKKIPRKAYYITTKVGCHEYDKVRMVDLRGDRILQAVDESLRRLGLSYIDLLQLQIHDREFEECLPRLVSETLPALDCARFARKVRYIGITGYSLRNIQTLVEHSPVEINAIVSYARGYMGDLSLLDYIPFFRDRGIGVINGSTTGLGLLTQKGPPCWHPATPSIRLAAQTARDLAKDEGVKMERLGLSYSLNLGQIDTTLVGMGTAEMVRENLEVSWFALTPQEFRVRDLLLQRSLSGLLGGGGGSGGGSGVGNWEGAVAVAGKKKKPRHSPGSKR